MFKLFTHNEWQTGGRVRTRVIVECVSSFREFALWHNPSSTRIPMAGLLYCNRCHPHVLWPKFSQFLRLVESLRNLLRHPPNPFNGGTLNELSSNKITAGNSFWWWKKSKYEQEYDYYCLSLVLSTTLMSHTYLFLLGNSLAIFEFYYFFKNFNLHMFLFFI